MKEISKFLLDDIKKLKMNISKNFAKIVSDELTEECRNAIEDFYDQYDPEDPSLHNGRIYYYRHWNFKNSYRRYYKNKGNRFIGGVELLQDKLPDVYNGKNSSPQSVFDRVYLGLHGIASQQNIGVPRMSPSPVRRVLNKQKNIVDNYNKYADQAISSAFHDSYYFL